MRIVGLLKYLPHCIIKNIPGSFFSIPWPAARCIVFLFCIAFGSITLQPVYGQDTTKTKKEKKGILWDTLDNKLDLSRFVIDAKGFVPILSILTEPALGGFGVALAPLFIKPKKNTGGKRYVPPDITAAVGMYTANNSWLVGAFRMGNIPKAGLKYRVGIAYGNIMLTYYRDIQNAGEKKYEFELDVLPVLLSLSKEIGKTDIYLGLQYTYANIKAKPQFGDSLPSFIKPGEMNNDLGELGIFIDWDKRNTIFTADKGARVNILFSASDNWTGSDFEYQRLNSSLNWFLPIKPNWISGLRAEVLHVFNEPPFYAYPSINLRGIPYARYQGATTALMETEQRFDFTKRWSAVAFGGLGKAMFKDESFGEAETVYNIGTGFRYLLARAFKLRAGIDIAKGPDSWGWYIVFGHNWNK